MKKNLACNLVTALVLVHHRLCLSVPLSETDEPVLFGDDVLDGYGGSVEDPADREEVNKRLSHFVRIGKGLSSFVRIGRNFPEDEQADFPGSDVDGSDVDKRKSAFVRIGRNFGSPEKRLSSFVRIGKGGLYDQGPSEMKRAGFIRMGKIPSSAFVRSRGGRVQSLFRTPYYRRTGRIGHSSFIRIGKRDTSDAVDRLDLDRLQRYIRIGKELNGDYIQKLAEKIALEQSGGTQEKRYGNFVRIGKSHELEKDENKRMGNFVRIGRGPEQNQEEKRMSNFVRIGKNYGNTSGIKDQNEDGHVEKEKRMSSFVRIGKDHPQQQEDKRFSSFVRIGKSTGDMQLGTPDGTPNKANSKIENYNAADES